jgi:hypothetical protein
MSPDADRVPVPTNGRGPHPIADLAPPTSAGSGDRTAPDAGAPSDEDMATAFSPKQVAIGFGIVASLVLVLASWARRRRSGG